MLKLKYSDYLNKVHGGWIGKCIGGAIGAQQENNKSLMNFTMENVFPDTIPPNDDLDLQVLWLQEVLEKKGSAFTSSDLAAAFARYNLCMANEYTIAIKNIELGIDPPWSGVFNNSFFKNSMGCPIRSEIWGFICPGNPEKAARFAQMDGMIDHDVESITAEKFFAALEANAFFQSDIITLIHSGLQYVPNDTELSRCIHFVMECFEKGLDWKTTRQKTVTRFGAGDASYSVINIGITVMALLFGKGDLTQTLLIAVNSGYDTDCTAATAGAIMGQIIGADRISDFWLEKVGEEVIVGTVDIQRSSNKIIDLAIDTCKAGLSLIRDGVVSIEIEEIPQNVDPSLPLPGIAPSVELTTAYIGQPSIGVGEPSCINVQLTNCTDSEVEGVLVVNPPENLFTAIGLMKLSLPAGSNYTVPMAFKVRDNATRLPQKNLIGFTWRQENGQTVQRKAGLSGAARMKVIGPFWDDYDTTLYEAYPYGNKRQSTPDGWHGYDMKAMFNSFVNIERPYIDESFQDLDQLEGEFVSFHEDRLRFDNVIKYKGPCCIYLVHDFICPDDRDEVYLHIGHCTPYKFWLNGKHVSESKDFTMWMPYNAFSSNNRLAKGHNRVVMKLVSAGSSPDFSYLMSSEQFGEHWFVDMTGII